MAHARCPQCKTVSHFQTNEEVKERRRDQYKEDEDGFLQIDRCLVCGWGGIDRSVDHGGYFNRELAGVAVEWPSMGRLCPHCSRRLPHFIDLKPETASRARGLIKAGRMEAAIQAIREATGCPITWARLWTEHPNGPIAGEP